MSHLTGKAAMPAPRSTKAPKMFYGDDEDIAEFLKVYETCAGDAQLLKAEWVKVMFRYLERSQRLIFEAFDGYAAEDWDVFSASIKEAFGGAFQSKKCTHSTLDSFIQTSAAKAIITDTEFRVYHRCFQDTQEPLERRLSVIKPDHPHEDPYAISDVYQAGCYVLNSNTFTRAPPLPTPSPEDSFLQSQGVEEVSRVVKKTVQFPREQPGDVQDLLKHLRDFEIDDAAYMTTYFQILAKDPACMNMLQPAKAFIPALPARVPASQPAPQARSLPVSQPCAFCNTSNCSGIGPRECPIGQEYVREGKMAEWCSRPGPPAGTHGVGGSGITVSGHDSKCPRRDSYILQGGAGGRDDG
ncbi:hypothetical protein JB92DRAFT_2832685 [Gautieria morchelliformis]|nr:hypothetical protein JB92DRAFT_2832685 [Gautieria morchelliformis]